MTCIKCGNQVSEGMYCDQCGTRAIPASAPSVPPPPPPPGSPPPMGAQASPAPQSYRPYTPPAADGQGGNTVPTVGNFVVVQLLMMIPLVNIILLIIWAVGGSGTPMWKTNYSKAQLIVMLIGIALSVIIIIALSVVLMTLMVELEDVFDAFTYY